jgi:hypothetical protein
MINMDSIKKIIRQVLVSDLEFLICSVIAISHKYSPLKGDKVIAITEAHNNHIPLYGGIL